jgi:hypothetical protein
VIEVSSSTAFQARPRSRPAPKVSWSQATRLFFQNKGEVGFVSKLTTAIFTFAAKSSMVTLPLTILDEPLDAVPGIDFITMGDDVMAVFGVIMVVRIAMFRSKCNRRLREETQPHRA